MDPNPYYGRTRQELVALYAREGLNAHQARLTFQAFYRHGVLDPEQMPEVSATCKSYLRKYEVAPRLQVSQVQQAQDGTVKLRLALSANTLSTPEPLAVEAVLIPAQERMTLCLSSQVGCAVACAFCHTGRMGLLRNLETWELIEQFRLARKYAQRPITNVVFMGMGVQILSEKI